MADEPTTPAVEQDVLETPEQEPEVTTETPETPDETPETKPELTVEELRAQLAASEAKLAKAVKAEQTLRTRAQTAETELTGFKTAAQEAEAERIANLSLAEQLAEERKKREAAETRATQVETQAAERLLEDQLGAAGFLAGLEGEAKTSQLSKLKALTSLEFVKEEGAFSIDAFATHFGGLKPAVAETPTEPVKPPVVDLGGKTPAPSEPKAERKQQLLAQLKTAESKGDRSSSIAIRRELHNLSQKK